MAYTPQTLFQKLKDITIGSHACLFTQDKCAELAPKINRILTLKKEKNIPIFAHSYISPEIIYTIADAVGDSYYLSIEATKNNADTILFCAVKFMAETAKILTPKKTILTPNTELNGCTLADAISAKQVQNLKKKYPRHTFICYINTTAAVKAECDICVTSSNAYSIIKNINAKKIYFIPDVLMGKNLADELAREGIKKELLYGNGTCYVHEKYDPDMITYLRLYYPDLEVLCHPECTAAVVANCNFSGSTSQMFDYVKKSRNRHFFILTECGLINRLQIESPEKILVGACTLCKYMKANTLDLILEALESPSKAKKIQLKPQVAARAKKCLDQMIRLTEKFR